MSDLAEIWAATGGIEFSRNCCRWKFEDGMLFGSMIKYVMFTFFFCILPHCSFISWRLGSSRSLSNNGTDFHSYIDQSGEVHFVQQGARVRPILPGVVFAAIRDDVGCTLVVSHSAVTCGSEGEMRLTHTSDPELHVRAWPPNHNLLTIYSHIDPLEGLQVGTVVSQSSFLGVVQNDSVHLSLSWIHEETRPPQNMSQVMSYIFAEPPTPVGSNASDFIRECEH